MQFDQVNVLEACDGFYLVLMKDGKKYFEYGFDQEDDKQGLVEMFIQLGFKSEYEEIC